MINESEVWTLKPSREGQTIQGKAVFGGSLTQAEIQKYKNQGYAHWFMLKPQPQKAEPAQPPVQKDAPREEGEPRPKAKPSGIEKLDTPPQE